MFWSLEMIGSEASYMYEKKKCISLQKIALLAFFGNCKMKKFFLKHPFSIIFFSDLFNKL